MRWESKGYVLDPTEVDTHRLVAAIILMMKHLPIEPTEFAWAWGVWRQHIVGLWALEPISKREESPDVLGPDRLDQKGNPVSHYLVRPR